MGRNKKYKTEEERKQAKKESYKKWRLKNIEKVRELSRKCFKKYYWKNKENIDKKQREKYKSKKINKQLDK